MKIADFFRLFIHDVKHQKSRVLFLLISLIILLVPIIASFTMCDMGVDYREQIIVNEYLDSGSDFSIDSREYSHQPELYDFVNTLFSDRKIDYTIQEDKEEYSCFGYGIDVLNFDVFNKSLVSGSYNDDMLSSSVWVSSKLYKIINEQMGIEIGEEFKGQFTHKQSQYMGCDDFSKIIGGVFESDELEVYMNNFAYYEDFGYINRIRYSLSDDSTSFDQINAKYTGINDIINNKIDEYYISMNIEIQESSNFAYLALENPLDSVRFTATMFYCIACLISLIMFGVILNNLITTLSISYLDTNRTYYLFSVLGMKQRVRYGIILLETLIIILLSFVLSVLIVVALQGVIIMLTGTIFSVTVGRFYMSWYTLVLLPLFMIMASLLFVFIKFVSRRNKSSIQLLRGGK